MSSAVSKSSVDTLRWDGTVLSLLDQRVLPARTEYLELDTVEKVGDSIARMVVRGAPAIGVAAAYGAVLAIRARLAAGQDWRAGFAEDMRLLEQARPTAINLGWAVNKMRTLVDGLADDEVAHAVEEAARRIHSDDVASNRRMGELGAELIESRCEVLTHCNAGALATAGYGTALGVIRSAHSQGKIEKVLADETRPWLQGSRLTAWELVQENIPVDLIADGAATWAMRQGRIKWVIVGADRVAANGDVANKIGTYSLAVSARHHGVRFMVVAPTSTIDMDCASGASIPIEQRGSSELFSLAEQRIAAQGAGAWNPVFDVTPASLVDFLVTEKGVVEEPTTERIAKLFES